MKSFLYNLENEIDEVREGAIDDASEEEIADIIEQLNGLNFALRDGTIDFDATWSDVYEDTHVILVYEGQHERVVILDMDDGDDSCITLVVGNEVCQFERGSFGGYYEINNAQERYSILLESGM